MRIVNGLEKINAATDSIAVNTLLVLVNQDNIGSSSPCCELLEAPDHLVSKYRRTNPIVCCNHRWWIERKKTNVRCAERVSQGNCTLKALQVLIKRAIEQHLTNRRANRSYTDALIIQLLLDLGHLLIREVKHIDPPDGTQIDKMNVFAVQYRNLLVQVSRNLISESRESNHVRMYHFLSLMLAVFKKRNRPSAHRTT